MIAAHASTNISVDRPVGICDGPKIFCNVSRTLPSLSALDEMSGAQVIELEGLCASLDFSSSQFS